MGRGPWRGVAVHLGLEMSVEDRVPGSASRTTASGKGWYTNSVPGEGFTVWRCSSTWVPSGFRGSRAPTQLEAAHLEQCLQCRELWDSSRPQTLFQKGLGQQLWKAVKNRPLESVSFSHSWDAVGRWHPLASPRTKTA